MDELLSTRTAASGAQLTTATIFDKLSAIKSSFAQAGLPPIQWPPQALRAVTTERTARRVTGTEVLAVKPPFMPRVAVHLDKWLRHALPASTGAVAAVAVLLSFYFGWRASTVSALTLADIDFRPEASAY